jgi:hypothetical protein
MMKIIDVFSSLMQRVLESFWELIEWNAALPEPSEMDF